MTTIKTYTDLEQSKKLAEILPLESADMFCADVFNKEKETHSYNFHILSTWGCNTFEELKDRENKFAHFIPCWSLSALLGVLPKDIIYDGKIVSLEFHVWENSLEYVNNADYTLYVTESYNNPVDACVEMILKLHELNLL